MKLMITGHRPHKLGGYAMNSAAVQHIEEELRKIISQLDPRTDVGICGMAPGADQLFAEICMEFHISVHAYIPFRLREQKWLNTEQRTYRSLLRRCAKVIECNDHVSIEGFQVRNAMMVLAADEAVAVWDGSNSGTANTIKLLNIVQKKFVVIEV